MLLLTNEYVYENAWSEYLKKMYTKTDNVH